MLKSDSKGSHCLSAERYPVPQVAGEPTSPMTLCAVRERTTEMLRSTHPASLGSKRIPSRPGMALPEPDHIPIGQLGCKTHGAGTQAAVLQRPPGPALAVMGGLPSRGALLDPEAPQGLTYSLSFSSCMRALSVYFCAFSEVASLHGYAVTWRHTGRGGGR